MAPPPPRTTRWATTSEAPRVRGGRGRRAPKGEGAKRPKRSALKTASMLKPQTRAQEVLILEVCGPVLSDSVVGGRTVFHLPIRLVPFHFDTLILKTSNGAPCCSQRNPPRFLRPWPMILV